MHAWGKFRADGGKASTIMVGHGAVGAWRVPRLWILLHEVPRISELRALAEAQGWQRAA